MTPEQGFGLEGVLRQRAGDFVGILNGVDYGQWNPWTDPLISHHYGEHSLTNKRDCKDPCASRSACRIKPIRRSSR